MPKDDTETVIRIIKLSRILFKINYYNICNYSATKREIF